MFTVVDLQKIFYIGFVGTFSIYLRYKYHMPGSNGSLGTGIKPKADEKFPEAALFS
jgi:hypothetical protein